MNSPLTQPEQFVLITGSPVTGFVLTGPFNSRDDAVQFAVRHHTHGTYWIAPLFNPKE